MSGLIQIYDLAVLVTICVFIANSQFRFKLSNLHNNSYVIINVARFNPKLHF